MTSTPPEATTLLDSAINTDEQDLRIAQLVASYSLLHPSRRGSRRDVVISTLITVLAARQSMTSARLFHAIRTMWKTSTLNDEVLTAALNDSREAGLVVERASEGQQTYLVSADAANETEQDRLYVSHLLEDFQNQVSDRLNDYPDAARLAQQEDRIVSHVLTSVARACRDSYAIDVPGAAQSVRPMSVSQLPAIQYAERLEPKSIRIPVRDLALDALDTGEPFGNDIVHLIVVSRLLLGLTTQRGVTEAPSLQHMQVILDTSFLIDLLKPDGHSERRTLLELISLSDRCNAKLVVADHTVAEWSRLWESADAEMAGSGNRVETISSGIPSRLVSNPFLSAYIDYRNDDGNHSWIRWSESRGDLESLLRSLPISIEAYDEQDESDKQCYERLITTLTRLSRDKTIPASRTRAAAEADARTATMVARRRKHHGEGSAIFVSTETLTNRAYAECFPNSKPLVIQPTLWLQYVGCLIVDDPMARIDIADLIADVAVRYTVLRMASSYTLEEVLGFSDVLMSEGIEPNAQMIRDLDDPMLFDVTDELHREAGESLAVRGQAVIARRGTRLNQRAANRESRLQTRLGEMQRVASARSAEADAQRARAESEQQRADKATHEKDALAESNSRLHRIIHASSASGVALILLVVLSAWGFLGGWAIVLGVLGANAGVLYAYHWVGSAVSKPSRMWITGFGQVVWHIVLSIVF